MASGGRQPSAFRNSVLLPSRSPNSLFTKNDVFVILIGHRPDF